MSYNLTLRCGCMVYIACHPRTGVAHTRVLECRGGFCQVRKHEIGMRLTVAELATQQGDPPSPGPSRTSGGDGPM